MRYAVAVAVLLLLTTAASAQDRLDELATVVNQSTATPKTEAAAVERMAKTLGTGADALRAEHTASGLGWGDLFLAHRVAKRGGHPVDKVIAARRTGANWTEIADEARVDADALVGDVVASFPDAARVLPKPAAPPAAPAPAEPAEKDTRKSGGFFDFLRGKPSGDAGDKSAPGLPQPADDISDRMLRGAGQKQR